MTITLMKSKEKTEETEKCVDSQFWHACAGNMVQMPSVNSKVFYFPQGHFEQCSENVDLGNCPRFPHCIPCTVSTIKLLATPDMDEVFAKIRLVPVNVNTLDFGNDGTIEANVENQDKPLLVTKRLSQSDANCSRGFVIPKHWGEMIFPKLEGSTSDPADQKIHVKDIHGRVWEFKHISDDKPSGHTLTIGWIPFVKHKKLVAGDSIFLMSSENGDLCVGIRREKSSKELVKVEDVTGALSLAARGKPFEVVYWPRAGTPEFCVRASLVHAAMRIHWSHGMKFEMAFEQEDRKRTTISWFTGTILSAKAVDPVLWPNSPWRLLQVRWDVPMLQMDQNVKRISPWQVKLESSMPTIHPLPSLPRPPTKTGLPPPQHPDVVGKDTLSAFSNNAPAGMQGARHDAQYGLSSSNLPNLSNIQSSLLPLDFLRFDPSSQPTAPSNPIISKPGGNENMSRLRNSAHESKKSDSDEKAPKFMLFGQPIHIEEQISSMSHSSDTVLNSSSDSNADRVGNTSDVSGSGINHNDRPEELCKVFTQSEDVGWTVDLSLLGSYEELYEKMASVFRIKISDIPNRVVYSDNAGVVRQLGKEPFSDFVKTAKSLTILADSGSDNVGV